MTRKLPCPVRWSADTTVTPTAVSVPLISRYRRDACCSVRPSDHQIPPWRENCSVRSADQQFPLPSLLSTHRPVTWGLVTQSDVVSLVQESDGSLLNSQICAYVCSYFLFSDCCAFLPSAIKLHAERASALMWNLWMTSWKRCWLSTKWLTARYE
jgi:hypothetical protein